MDPFEQFLELKLEIENDQNIMRNLREYSFNKSHNLPYLGEGLANLCYRIGNVNGLWLASREYIDCNHIIMKRIACEGYIKNLILNHKSGKKVPNICGCVNVKRKNFEKYFLLVEDLSNGGNSDFIPGKSGRKSGTVNGSEVFYDFDEDFSRIPKTYQYMNENNMIQLI